jgi:hypothetical protein
MSYYVKIPRLNGRKDHAELGKWLLQSGAIEVDYFSGGWNDRDTDLVHSHLKFEIEQDAIAFSLAHCCQISKSVPIRDSN